MFTVYHHSLTTGTILSYWNHKKVAPDPIHIGYSLDAESLDTLYFMVYFIQASDNSCMDKQVALFTLSPKSVVMVSNQDYGDSFSRTSLVRFQKVFKCVALHDPYERKDLLAATSIGQER